jgi:hypothetical protein
MDATRSSSALLPATIKVTKLRPRIQIYELKLTLPCATGRGTDNSHAILIKCIPAKRCEYAAVRGVITATRHVNSIVRAVHTDNAAH